MKNNTVITILLSFFLYAGSQLYADEWHVLYVPGEGNATVTLAEDEEAWVTRLDLVGMGNARTNGNKTVTTNVGKNGDVAEGIESQTTIIETPDVMLQYLNPGDTGQNGPSDFYFGGPFGSSDKIWVPGPRIIILKNQQADIIATCLITVAKKEPTETSKKFATVIPENSSGNISIILEQSTDLINWTAVSPGSFAPSTTKRFFRVRAEEE